MTELISKAAALKMLQERTGRKFSSGIFSPRPLRRGRIWCCSRLVDVRDVEAFLLERAERQAEKPEDALRRRVKRLLADIYLLDRRMDRLGKAYPAAADSLAGCCGWMWYGTSHLRGILCTLPKKAAADHTDSTDRAAATDKGQRTTD